MNKVKLTTRDGGFVAEIQVPPLNPPYEVILWGQRVFVWDGAAQNYREGLMFIDLAAFIAKEPKETKAQDEEKKKRKPK